MKSGKRLKLKMVSCYKYAVSIHYRAGKDSDRERMLLECARAYACDIGPHLIDRLLEDRLKLFEARAQETARLAAEKARIAEEERKLHGG